MRLHHVGFVTENVEEAGRRYHELGVARVSEAIEDPVQKMKAVFVNFTHGAQLELLEPASADSPLAGFLDKRGGGLHHVCYEVADLVKTLELFVSKGALKVCEPVPAVAFNGRRIAFVYTALSELVELLEERA